MQVNVQMQVMDQMTARESEKVHLLLHPRGASVKRIDTSLIKQSDAVY
jgi:hypothetical protein